MVDISHAASAESVRCNSRPFDVIAIHVWRQWRQQLWRQWATVASAGEWNVRTAQRGRWTEGCHSTKRNER